MKRLLQSRRLISLLMISIVLMILIICPLYKVFQEALVFEGRFNLSHMLSTIFDARNLKTIQNSLLLGFTVVILSSIIAAPFAYLISKTQIARHSWLDLVCMIPFMTPPYISSMGWILFMQKNGMLAQLFPSLSWISDAFFSFFGLALVMSFHVFPFMVTILKNAFLNLNSSLEEAGSICGGGFWYRMRHIVLPLVTGNYAIGALLVFVKTISEYGTPSTLGQRIGFYVFTTDIHRYSTTSPIDFGKSASLSSVLITICLILWMLQSYITTKKSYALVGGKGKRVVEKHLSRPATILSWCFIIGLLTIAIGIPYFSVIATSLIKLRGYGLSWDNLTFQHYIDLFTKNPKGIAAIQSTLFVAISAATIAMLLGVAIVFLIRKAHPILKKVLEAVSLLPEMLPGITIVIGLMLFWNSIYHILPLYNTLWILVITFVVLFLPYTIQYVNSSLSQINENLVQAGKTFGGSNWYIFKRILFPLILPGACSGWIMTFIISFRELVAPSMIAPPNVLTVSTFIVREFEQGSVSVGMAMAVICVLITTGVLLIVNVLLMKKGMKRL